MTVVVRGRMLCLPVHPPPLKLVEDSGVEHPVTQRRAARIPGPCRSGSKDAHSIPVFS